MKQEEPMDLWVYEREAFDAGIRLICGVDEAGRGPLAGPVCAAAVILPPGLEIPGLNDSKKLTDKKRRELYDIITAQAVSYGIAFASEQEIDEINILQATFLAMERAMQKLSPQPELALIDGNRTKDFGLPVQDHRQGRQSVRLHRRRVDPGQGHAGSADGGIRRAVPAVRLRRPQGLRHEAAL